MNLITSFLHNPMRREDIGLVLLSTRVINLLGRSTFKTSPYLRLNPPEGEDQPQDMRSEVFVYGRPHPDGEDQLRFKLKVDGV